MGMSDRQFDTYQQSLLRDLERIEEEVLLISNGKKSKSLDKLKRDIEDHLKRP
jgi:hypothetical protein